MFTHCLLKIWQELEDRQAKEKSGSRPESGTPEQEEPQQRNQSIAQVIYAENRVGKL